MILKSIYENRCVCWMQVALKKVKCLAFVKITIFSCVRVGMWRSAFVREIAE